MSSVAGLVRFSGGAVTRPDMDAMLDAMAGRGRDASSVWLAQGAGLGQSMLQTTPESRHEVLPFEHAGLVITADARIDNRVELAAALACSDLLSGSVPDSHLILRAYRRWGTDCANYLLGDFSFAIWDIAKQQLYCAIDPFGVRPFYYHWQHGQFIFASSIAGLLPGRMIPHKLNEFRIAAVMDSRLLEADSTTTLLRDVHCLQGAHQMTVSVDGIRVSRYWDPQEIRETCLPSDDDYAEQFLEIFQRAVKCRLRSEAGVALALSGGIDSTAIAAVAGKILQDSAGGMIAYSGVSDYGERCRETDNIRLSVEALGCPSSTFGKDAVLRIKDKLLTFLHDSYYPRGIESVFLFCLYHEVFAGGKNVLLDGAEGDTALTPAFTALAYRLRQGKFSTAFREAALLAANTYAGGGSTASVLSPAIRLAVLPRSFQRALSGLKLRSQASVEGEGAWLRRSFASEVGINKLLRQAQDNRGYGLPVHQPQYHARIFRRAYISRMHYAIDMLASHFPLEMRHPYLDKRLVSFCVSLPLEQKIRDGWLKSILRRSNIERIPSEVRWSKGREHVGWKFLLATYALLADEIHAAVNDRQHLIYDYFSHRKVYEAFHACQKATDSGQVAALMRFYGLYCWLTSRP